MKNFSKFALTAFAAVALTACGGDKKEATKTMTDGKTKVETTVKAEVETSGATGSYTKAEYMKACTSEGGMTEKQCTCIVDFYEDNGMKVQDMADEGKMTKFMNELSQDKMMDMGKCMM